MTAASFTAWQIGTIQGLKVSWKKYLKDLNLLETEKIDKKESRKTAEVALRILKKLGKI